MCTLMHVHMQLCPGLDAFRLSKYFRSQLTRTLLVERFHSVLLGVTLVYESDGKLPILPITLSLFPHCQLMKIKDIYLMISGIEVLTLDECRFIMGPN